jgi:trehalose 6-phosphate synthase/phosphatase
MNIKYIDENFLKEIKSDYDISSSRIILFDYDGTLIPFTENPDDAIISFNVIDLINKFTKDVKNNVVIISGRDRHFLDIQFWNMKVTLIAEHGYLIKAISGKWGKNLSLDLSWKESVYKIFAKYAIICDGSIIEEKESSLAWHYRKTTDECIKSNFKNLKKDLQTVLLNYSKVQILEGNKVLEVKSVLFNKGTAINKFIETDGFNFIMAIGDDNTDEDLFKVLPKSAYTIKIGSGPSFAKFSLKDQSQVYKLLNTLI